MSNPILHIKDAYFFEVPKFLAPANYKLRSDFPDVWVQLDDQYQDWEFHRLYKSLKSVFVGSRVPSESDLHHSWRHWQHADHVNFSKPLHRYLEDVHSANLAKFEAWKKREVAKAGKDAKLVREAQDAKFSSYVAELKDSGKSSAEDYLWFSESLLEKSGKVEMWKEEVAKARDVSAYKRASEKEAPEWSSTKVANYNYHLSGKVLVPQLLGGRLRNLHEPESGICISKFMVIELAVVLALIVVLGWVGARSAAGSDRPKGKIWNLFESFFVFIRDQIAEPAIGHHDAHAFTPFLATIFFFILGMNLAGMLPWSGSPTGSFSVTLALALVTFATVVICGMAKMGPLGFFTNLVPHMDLPPVLAVVLKPAIFVLEFAGMLIKHGVLAVRLLANMMAGHLVLGAIMGLAFGASAVAAFSGEASGPWWYIVAPMALLGCTALSLLELFVAFLQAYVFTLLSALFIGAAIHHH